MAPRLSHVLIFVCDLERMIAFYAAALGLRRHDSPDGGFVMMRSPTGAAIALHQVPAEVAAELDVKSPATWREDTATKLCFEVDDLASARQALLAAGGQAKEPWSWAGADYCDCADAEGNVLQLVAPTPPA